MKGAIEIFAAVVLIAFMAVLSTSYITASIDTRNAQNFHATAISKIEASNFSQQVIDECIEDAKENGFLKEDGSSGLTVVKMEELDLAEVTLIYHYTMPLLNSVLEHELVGYAR